MEFFAFNDSRRHLVFRQNIVSTEQKKDNDSCIFIKWTGIYSYRRLWDRIGWTVDCITPNVAICSTRSSPAFIYHQYRRSNIRPRVGCVAWSNLKSNVMILEYIQPQIRNSKRNLKTFTQPKVFRSLGTSRKSSALTIVAEYSPQP